MSSPSRTSVIIPTYQRCQSVRRALTALAGQTRPADEYEVIVSIDGSRDGTDEMLGRFTAPYRLRGVWQENQGRAAALNVGIRLAEGDLLVLLDDDMEPAPGFVAAHHRAHGGQTELGVLGAVPITVDSASTPLVRYVGRKFNRHLEKVAAPGYSLRLRDFYSGNFSMRRDTLLRIGGFDEDFKVYGNEDLELFVRLRRAGVRLAYSREALAHQHYAKSFGDLARDTANKGRTAVLLARKHPETFTDLKLGERPQGSIALRAFRALLLGLDRLTAGTPERVIRIVERLERHLPVVPPACYGPTLDYFYWHGARSALADAGAPGDVATLRTEPARKSHT